MFYLHRSHVGYTNTSFYDGTNFYAALQVRVCASQVSLDVWDLHFVSLFKFKPIFQSLIIKNLLFPLFSKWFYYYILKCLIKTSYMFCSISGISVCKSHGPSVDIYLVIRGRNNSTCIQLCIPFNFAVVTLSDFILIFLYIRITYSLDVPTSPLWAFRFLILLIISQYNLL